jgi:hypothetical protein
MYSSIEPCFQPLTLGCVAKQENSKSNFAEDDGINDELAFVAT